MPYATEQDMVDRFGEREMVALTDRDNVGMVDATVLSKALLAADSEINPYLANRYALPLTSVPSSVRDFSCDIARYRLCGAEVTETDEVRIRYKDAIKFFEKVAAGKISLGLDDLNNQAASSQSIMSQSNARVFSKTTLGDYA